MLQKFFNQEVLLPDKMSKRSHRNLKRDGSGQCHYALLQMGKQRHQVIKGLLICSGSVTL